MKYRSLAALMAFCLILADCSKKKVEVKDWTNFQDPVFKVTFSYPKEWVVSVEPTRVVVTSSLEAAEKFFDRDPRKADGVQVIISTDNSVSTKDYAEYIKDFRDSKLEEGFQVGEIEDAKIEGLPAKQVVFYGAYDENTKVKALRIATVKDSVIYYVQYAALNDLFEPYKMVFDSILYSLVLPKKVKVEKGVDPAIPLAETEKYSDDYVEFDYPINFAVNDLPKKGDVLMSIVTKGKLEGARNDCTINLDVRPAKKLTLDKVVEQNSKLFKVVSKGETKISGERSVYFNYVPPVKNVSSRIYFVVKNDRIYRIILNYYTPMKKDFLPAFEKVVASIKIK